MPQHIPEEVWDLAKGYDDIMGGLNFPDGDANDPLTILIHAIHRQNLDLTKSLVIHGANVNLCDASGLTPLEHAVKIDNQEIINFLKHRDASDQCEPIFLVAMKDHHIKLIEELLTQDKITKLEELRYLYGRLRYYGYEKLADVVFDKLTTKKFNPTLTIILMSVILIIIFLFFKSKSERRFREDEQ